MPVDDVLLWKGVEVDSFLFKAQWNLNLAEFARKQSLFDIEANRTYYALHQLACELVRKERMTPDREGKHTSEALWKMDHGSYGNALRTTTSVSDADITVSRLMKLRTLADYEPEQVSKSEQWKRTVVGLRKKARELAEGIYGLLTSDEKYDHSTASTEATEI